MCDVCGVCVCDVCGVCVCVCVSLCVNEFIALVIVTICVKAIFNILARRRYLFICALPRYMCTAKVYICVHCQAVFMSSQLVG